MSLKSIAAVVLTALMLPACASVTTDAVDRAASDSSLAATHSARGDALFKEGKLEDAVAEYREAIRFDPANADPWIQLGQLYEMMGRGEDALQTLQMGLDADPGNVGVLNQIAWFYATAQNPALRDSAKAISYAQQAVDASGGSDANILDTLAEAYYANRQFDEAIETEERALEVAPGVETFQNQLKKFRDAKTAEGGC